ncbi:MAG: hypothetical protein J6I40_07635, partial [Mailhella sp.]|nr:hypothetical protein [Mailhella sp.]
MNFVTQSFALFFICALPLLLLSGGNRRVFLPVLLLCNIVFYSSAGVKGLSVLMLVSLIAWAGGRLLTRKKSKAVLAACIAAVLLLLA